jgi:hypothetical protein
MVEHEEPRESPQGGVRGAERVTASLGGARGAEMVTGEAR